MERTLYLSESRKLRVMRDGPSVLVEHRGRAPQRVPARLIRRVLVAGNVALDSGMLALFAERGVPVTLLDREGRAVAVVLGVEDGDRQRRARQASLAEDPRRRERVAAWLAAWERGRRLVLATWLDPAVTGVWRREGCRTRDYEAVVCAAARVRGAAPALRGFFRGAVLELVAAEVSAQGWDAHAGVRHRDQPLGFVKDCATVLHPDADRLWLESAAGGASGAAAAALFEAGRRRIESLARRLLSQYARLVWEG